MTNCYWLPVIDGVHVLGTPEQVIASGKYNKVPVIVGYDADEGRGDAFQSYGLFLSQQDYRQALACWWGAEYVDEIEAQYPASDYESPFKALGAAITDWNLGCSSRRIALLLSETNDHAYAYKFSYSFPLSAVKLSLIFSLFGFGTADPDKIGGNSMFFPMMLAVFLATIAMTVGLSRCYRKGRTKMFWSCIVIGVVAVVVVVAALAAVWFGLAYFRSQFGAFHGEDVFFEFHQGLDFGSDSKEEAISRLIIRDWTQFAATGKPTWPAISKQNDYNINYGQDGAAHVERGMGLGGKCSFWDSIVQKRRPAVCQDVYWKCLSGEEVL
eukprot:TRINITY_DN7132_c0_g1_i1.p1 TRINITY_DN7132_c0_g1~~TRINITY_DN7132_c0_g1_i1.p1  ORF type:complete len:326 (-),score=33.50 TRINITY_DN7132_c0_g1_i1:17-994(-)